MADRSQFNQAGPFWDWIAAMDSARRSGQPPPWFDYANSGEGPSQGQDTEMKNGGNQDKSDNKNEKSVDSEPAPEYDGEDPPTPPEEHPADPEDPPEEPPKDPGHKHPPHHGCAGGPHGHHGRGGRGRCGGGGGPGVRGRGGWGGRGGGYHGCRGNGRNGFPFSGPPPHHRGGGPAPFFPFAGPWAQQWGERLREFQRSNTGDQAGWAQFANMLVEQLGLNNSFNNNNRDGNGNDDDTDFTPPVDVFDTPREFVVHVALPGARKEDVGVTWDEAAGELAVAGVVTRSFGADGGEGGEINAEMLVRSERPVGVFRRVVKLGGSGGNRAAGEKAAAVDVDGISAKMEEGLLVIHVPKLESEGFVEVKKVDIE